MADQNKEHDSESQKGQFHMASKEKVSAAPETKHAHTDKEEKYPGMVHLRVPENMDISKAKAWQEDIYRLRLERIPQNMPLTELTQKKAETKPGICDILVPGSLTLSALHHTIQSMFGVKDELSHYYSLPQQVWEKLTQNDPAKWQSLVGVLFQSPVQKKDDIRWRRMPETAAICRVSEDAGPYMATAHRESLWQCCMDMQEVGQYMSLKDMSLEEVQGALHTPIDHLLERLSIDHLLAFHDRDCQDVLAEGEKCFDTYEEFMHDDLQEDIEELLFWGQDEPERQPSVDSPTDTLYYTSQGAECLQIKITGSRDAADLVEQGILTEDALDKAVQKLFMEYRPVCIALR